MPRQAPASKGTSEGQRRNEILVERDKFGAGAEIPAVALPIVEPDAVAQAEAGDTGAHLVDDASAVAVSDDDGGFHRVADAAATVAVGRIDARGHQA